MKPHKSRDFFGSIENWDKVIIRLNRSASYRLDGVRIEVRGNGTATLTRDGTLSGKPCQADITIAKDEVYGYIELLISKNLMEMEIEKRSGQPDEVTFTLTVINAKGQEFQISKWGGDTHEVLNGLMKTLAKIISQRVSFFQRKRFYLPDLKSR